eukprot:SAG31_NODE_41612_length_275_cov_0.636364_1_plen_51_part_01
MHTLVILRPSRLVIHSDGLVCNDRTDPAGPRWTNDNLTCMCRRTPQDISVL